jgi:hypothetical protein
LIGRDYSVKRLALGVCAVIAIFAVAIAALDCYFSVDLPTFAKPRRIIWLSQGWDSRRAAWFHHADQGTETFPVPYEWFVALEQPSRLYESGGLLANTEYLDRYGFIPEERPNSLPIGFAHRGQFFMPSFVPWRNPATGKSYTRLGLTCAACHTGRISYQGTEVRIEGAPAATNLDLFQKGLAYAVLKTRWDPFRLHRFQNHILGEHPTSQAKEKLNSQLAATWALIKKVKDLDDRVAHQRTDEGYCRLDALNRIGNMVFSLDLQNDANYAAQSAPVHYPRIWDAPWFLWVQYDGSIEQPMIRNAGEALGVAAPLDLSGGPNRIFTSTLRVDALYAMEHMLAGSPPGPARGFTGLRAPRWPAGVLPPINVGLARQGQRLYADLCQKCHLPPVGTPAFWNSKYWRAPNSAGERYLDLPVVHIPYIGTDPAEATSLATRTVNLHSPLGGANTPFGPALGDVVQRVVAKYYDTQRPPTSNDDRQRMNGHRPNGIRALLAYKARPLDGIWATPPYLHNASVPTLYDLLSPTEERPASFSLGGREYDPVNVGLKKTSDARLFKLDTVLAGNRATGHEFSNKRRPGRIGRYLQPSERHALVEYLKTL